MADLIIRIDAESKGFEDRLKEAQSQTENLENSLTRLAKVSAVAFAAFSAEIFLSVKAFGESEQASNQLTAALQQQGIFSKQLQGEYQNLAEEIQNYSGVSDDAIVAGQAQLQNLIGQLKITPELTKAVVDFAAAQRIDVASAFTLVGKTIGSSTNALGRYGIEIDDNKSKSEKLSQVVDALSGRFEGQAAAAGKGVGSLKILAEAFNNLQEEIGRQFAPAIESAAKFLTNLINTVKNSKPLTDLIASLVVAGTVVTGLGTAIGVVGLAFLKLRSALIAANIATIGLGTAVKGLVGATGIGLLVVIATEIFLNWNTIFPKLQGIFATFTNNISQLGSGLGLLLSGIFTFNISQVKEGFNKIKEAFTENIKAYEKAEELKTQKEEEETNKRVEKQKSASVERERISETQRQREVAAEQAATNAKIAKLSGASQEVVALKEQESELLKQIADKDNAAIVGKLQERLELVRVLQEEAVANDAENRTVLREQLLVENEEFNALTTEQQATFLAQNEAQLAASRMTQLQAEKAVIAERIAIQIKANNDYLQNQIKFGTAYAAINKVIYSEQVQGAGRAASELVQLQTSNNSTLKSIGKAAAVADITIKTAQSAMNIFTGFSSIPFVGYALGIAGAAAAVAFGVEQIGKVTAAADGGVITGGVPGKDSVPSLLSPGELVTPAKNFDEVVNSVAQTRSNRTDNEGDIQDQTSQNVQLVVGFDGNEASRVLTVRQVQDRALGISRES